MAKTGIARRAAQTQVINQQTEPDRAAEIERMQQLLIKQEADEQQQFYNNIFRECSMIFSLGWRPLGPPAARLFSRSPLELHFKEFELLGGF